MLWLRSHPAVGGRVVCGEAGFKLARNPESTCGIDVAYIGPELANAIADDAFLIDGAPVLAVEILSPSDTHEDIQDKVDEYLRTGVKIIWIAEPVPKTITV